jgi:ABC-type transport system substrate-binding protein
MRTDMPESPFSVKDVRQAMMLAIDQPGLIEDYWQGRATLIGWPITAHPAYADAYVPYEELPENVQALYGHDVEAARALLATTPYPNGFDCSIIFYDTPVGMDILCQVQAMLEDININMTIDIHDYNVYLSRQRARNYGAYEMMYGNVSGNGTYMKMINLRGPNSYNVSYIDDPVVEEAYQEIVQYAGINEAAAMAVNKELMPYLLEQAYVIPMPNYNLFTLWWPWLENYYGVVCVGYYNYYGYPKYMWIDQDLKEDMGY